jgi:2-polyprenyl-3-methyl-5-hydroxy-6-metoxy-1,4-benzoquinol methylase
MTKIIDAIEQNTAAAARNAGYYDAVWPKLGTHLDYTDRNRVRFIVEVLADLPPGHARRILDLGCGRGWMAPFLARFGAVTGVDFSPVGIEFATAHFGGDAEFQLADASSSTLGLPENEPFDVVVCSEVIEHAPNHGALLAQIAALLRPGGVLALTTPNGLLWDEFRRQPRFQPDLQPVENWVTPNALRAELTAAGFCVFRHEGGPVFDFARGRGATLQRRPLEALFRRAGFARLYGRAIRRSAVYQFVAARHDGEE